MERVGTLSESHIFRGRPFGSTNICRIAELSSVYFGFGDAASRTIGDDELNEVQATASVNLRSWWSSERRVVDHHCENLF